MVSEVQNQLDPSVFQSPQSREGQQPVGRLRTLQASRETSAELNILTAEGDKVTLTAQAEARLTYADYRYRGETADGNARGQAQVADFSSSQSLEVTTEGQLNEEELADVERLVNKITRIIKKFLKGDFEGVFEKAGKLVNRFSNFSSLAGFGLNVEQTQRVTYTQQRGVALEPPTPISDPVSAKPIPEIPEVVDETAPPLEDEPDGGETSATEPQVNKVQPVPTEVVASADEAQGASSDEAKGAPAAASEEDNVGLPQDQVLQPIPEAAESDEENSDEESTEEVNTVPRFLQGGNNPLSTLMDKMVEAIEDSRVSSGRAKRFIPQLLRRVFHDLRHDPDLKGKRDILNAVQSALSERLNRGAQAEASGGVTVQYSRTVQTNLSLSITV